MRVVAAALLIVSLGLAPGCSSSPNQPTPQPPSGGPSPAPPPPPEPPPPGGPATPPAPRIAKVRFMAFGDSLTEGVISVPFTQTLVTIPHAYPARLADQLRARYYDQPELVVFNEGRAGEMAMDGRTRLPDAIKADTPEVLLLMDGANEINVLGRRGISPAVGAIEDMIKDARRRGLIVFVATLPPQRAGGNHAEGAPFLDELNAQIRKTALDEGATLVDVNRQLDLSFVGQDGLHLTEAGYTRLAEIFAAAIRQAFDLAPPQT